MASTRSEIKKKKAPVKLQNGGTGVEKLLGNVCDFEHILGKESAFGRR